MSTSKTLPVFMLQLAEMLTYTEIDVEIDMKAETDGGGDRDRWRRRQMEAETDGGGDRDRWRRRQMAAETDGGGDRDGGSEKCVTCFSEEELCQIRVCWLTFSGISSVALMAEKKNVSR